MVENYLLELWLMPGENFPGQISDEQLKANIVINPDNLSVISRSTEFNPARKYN